MPFESLSDDETKSAMALMDDMTSQQLEDFALLALSISLKRTRVPYGVLTRDGPAGLVLFTESPRIRDAVLSLINALTIHVPG